MIGVVARIKVKDGQQAAAEAVLHELVAAVNANEPEVKLYKLFKNRDGSGDLVMLELYTSAEALAAHRDMPHFKTIGAKLGPLLAGAPAIEYFDAV
jgi:quinol monooxygenase YgiN